MGGIGIYLGGLLACIIINPGFHKSRDINSLLFIFTVFFLIGFFDDYLKVRKKSSKGLRGMWRLSFEILAVMLILVYLGYEQKSRWSIHFPYPSSYLYIGGAFIVLAIVMIVGSSNGVNLTDGLDGLSSGLLLMAFAPFVILAIFNQEIAIAIFLCGIIGSILGFLIFNFHPAKIFMGDCGSLSLGAVLALSAFLLKAEFLLLIAGGIFAVETVSVILQVASFKMTKKRIFKMAPLHHHFEMGGTAEWKVVMCFYIAGFILSFLAILIGVS